MGDTPLSPTCPPINTRSVPFGLVFLPCAASQFSLHTHPPIPSDAMHPSTHTRTHARCLTRQKAADHAARTSQDTAKGPSFSVKPPYHWPPSISVSLTTRHPSGSGSLRRDMVTCPHARARQGDLCDLSAEGARISRWRGG